MRAEDVDWLLAPLPSGRHGLSREQVLRSQRLRLLHAAIAVAGGEGYAAMTVSAVIAQASVSRKTFYEQFVDREDCFLAAYELVLERGRAGILAAYGTEDEDVPWVERLRAALAWALAALAANPREARLAFVEVLTAGPRALARRDHALRDLAPFFAPGFEAAPAGAAVPASMPMAVGGALSELIAGHIRYGDAERLPELLPELLFCAVAPFVGPLAAADAAAPCAAASSTGRGRTG